MNGREDDRRDATVTPLDGAAPSAELRYVIELWTLPRDAPERVIGRAASMVLARAIFAAAESEHLGRKVVLRRGAKVLAETD
jgi:hypothetical protein